MRDVSEIAYVSSHIFAPIRQDICFYYRHTTAKILLISTRRDMCAGEYSINGTSTVHILECYDEFYRIRLSRFRIMSLFKTGLL
jgi:hypothetical protein